MAARPPASECIVCRNRYHRCACDALQLVFLQAHRTVSKGECFCCVLQLSLQRIPGPVLPCSLTYLGDTRRVNVDPCYQCLLQRTGCQVKEHVMNKLNDEWMGAGLTPALQQAPQVLCGAGAAQWPQDPPLWYPAMQPCQPAPALEAAHGLPHPQTAAATCACSRHVQVRSSHMIPLPTRPGYSHVWPPMDGQ